MRSRPDVVTAAIAAAAERGVRARSRRWRRAQRGRAARAQYPAARRLVEGASRGVVGADRRRGPRDRGRSPPTSGPSGRLLAAREPLYREVATEVVETTGRSARDVAADLASGLVAGGRDTTRRRARRWRPMKRLTVHAESRTYPILVGRDVMGELGPSVRRLRGEGQIVVVCDDNVAPLYLERARQSLVSAGLRVSQVILPAGEREKSLARAEELYGVLYDRGVRRSDTVVALGGGVIGDLDRLRGRHVPEGRGLRAGADDPARSGGRLGGWQGRRGLPRRQELRGHLLSAEPGAGRPAHAGDAAGARAPMRSGRGRQARPPRGQRRACGEYGTWRARRSARRP